MIRERAAAAPQAPAMTGAAKSIPPLLFYPLLATLVLYIAACTFASTFTTVINVTKWLALGALMIAAFAGFKGRRVPGVPAVLLIWLLMFLAITTIGSLFGTEEYFGIPSLFAIVSVIATGYAVAAMLVATDSRRAFFELVGTIGRVVVAGSALFFLAGVDLGRGGGFAAWLDNPNTLASVLAPGMVVFIAGCIERRPGWQWRHLAFLIVSLPLLWVTEGRSSFIWVGLAPLGFWLYRRGSWPAAVLAMIAMVVLIGWWEPITSSLGSFLQLDVDPTMTTTVGPLSGREEVWRVGWRLFWDRPVLGYGAGSSQDLVMSAYAGFIRFQGGNFHSSYITLFVENGVFGFIAFAGAMIVTVGSGIIDAKRTRMLPRESWPTAALPFVMVIGGLGHALFEAWLTSAGNVNTPFFWMCVWMVHFQAQVPVRAARRARAAATPKTPAAALPAR